MVQNLSSRLRRYILGVETERVLPSKLVIAVLLYALVFTENQQNWVCAKQHTRCPHDISMMRPKNKLKLRCLVLRGNRRFLPKFRTQRTSVCRAQQYQSMCMFLCTAGEKIANPSCTVAHTPPQVLEELQTLFRVGRRAREPIRSIDASGVVMTTLTFHAMLVSLVTLTRATQPTSAPSHLSS